MPRAARRGQATEGREALGDRAVPRGFSRALDDDRTRDVLTQMKARGERDGAGEIVQCQRTASGMDERCDAVGCRAPSTPGDVDVAVVDPTAVEQARERVDSGKAFARTDRRGE